MPLDRDEPRLEEDICDYCDEDSSECGRDPDDCMREAEKLCAEDRFEAERDARD